MRFKSSLWLILLLIFDACNKQQFKNHYFQTFDQRLNLINDYLIVYMKATQFRIYYFSFGFGESVLVLTIMC